MSPDRWKKIEQVYDGAVALSESERGPYIARNCGDDEELRKEVESLLKRHDSSPEGLLNRPAWQAMTGQETAAVNVKKGDWLGPYEIQGRLGAGGMGEVFRAHDTRLNRQVAVKVLHEQCSNRFEREARAIASLNHPNVCTLYDVGANYLVMELLQGETLAARIKKGPLPIDQVCSFGGQIAEALAAAHARGIIHRDLKPGNIMLTKTCLKVLDFGLAKSTADETLTMSHVVMGTPAYMSPEQRAGRVCDGRTDIYSLGLILREMATGKRSGAETSSEPLNRVIDRCLAEEPDDRWHSARDLRDVLGWLRLQRASAAPKRAFWQRWEWFAIVAILLLAALAGTWKWGVQRAGAPEVVRLALAVPEEDMIADPGRLSGPPVISPDGKVVVISLGANNRASLWSRRLDSDRFEKLEGTEGTANQPFWSPDGTQIAFFADGKLKKMKLPHGPPENLCDLKTETARGGAWSSRGFILFGINYKGIMKVPDSGGDPVLIAAIDERLKENSLRNPQFLADGNHFLYFARTLDPHNHATYIDAVDTVGKAARRKLLVSDGPAAIGHDPFSELDYVVFPKDRQLWAQRLDQSKGSLSGEKVAVSDDVGQFSLSRTGTLVFRRAGSEQNTLQWVDRSGKPSREVGKPGDYWDVSLAPDERHAAVQNHRSADGRFWVETIDLASNVQSALSDPAGRSEGPVWSPDSQSLTFTTWGDGQNRILRRRMDSAQAAEILYSIPERYDVRSATPDGKTLMADRWDGDNRRGLVFSNPLLSTGDPSSWRRFEEPAAILVRGQFSPDGRWIAYEAREGGTREIYITDFPKLSSRKRISPAGGSEPRWARDGKQLFYVSASGFLMDVAVASGASTSSPAALFRFPGQVPNAGGFSYDVSRDGKNFLVTNRTPPTDARDLSIIFNWPQLMGARGR